MNYNPRKLSITDINEEYQRGKRNCGICNDSSKKKILVQGENALALINHYATNKLTSDDNNKYIVLIKRHVFVDEVLVLKLSSKKYLLIVNNEKKIYHLLKKVTKKYPLTIYNDASRHFSLFTFHGNEADSYFNNIKNDYLYKTKHQNYTYFQLLVNKKEEQQVFNYFINNGFTPICLETKRIFLYNNKVIVNFKDVKWCYKKKLLNSVYQLAPSKLSSYSIEIYEVLETTLIPKNNKILDYKRKTCGIVYCGFRLPNKKFPFIIGLVNALNNNLLITKNGKNEVLVRKQYKQ